MTDNPAKHRIAAPHEWETATVGDVWRGSDLAGVPSCTILTSMQHLVGLDTEHVCDCDESV